MVLFYSRSSYGRTAGRKTGSPLRGSHFCWPVLLLWSHGRTENRYACFARSTLFLADAPLFNAKIQIVPCDLTRSCDQQLRPAGDIGPRSGGVPFVGVRQD